MISFENIEIYLPKYLAPESKKELFEGLKQFPADIDSKMYTSYLREDDIVFQGDGLEGLLFVNLPDKTVGEARGIVLSNTCDIDTSNKQFITANVVYAPILNLDKLSMQLCTKFEQTRVNDFIESVKKQYITQIFFLPKGCGLKHDSAVMLDKLNSCENSFIDRQKLKGMRLFTLSNLGLYVFIVKLSLHFMRIQEGVDRKSST